MEKENKEKSSDDAIAGAFAGLVSRLITAPLDVLKIRFQLQFGVDKKYTSTLQAFKRVVQEEGIMSLWKGNLAATYLWITYGVIQFGCYGIFKSFTESIPNPFTALDTSMNDNLFNKLEDKRLGSKGHVWKAFMLFLAGAGAGMAATTATYPFDIMRTQFAIQGNIKVHDSMRSFLSHTLSTKGVSGLYAGLPAALIGITPYMGLNFAFYESTKSALKHIEEINRKEQINIEVNSGIIREKEWIGWTLLRSGLSGAFAGGASKFIVFPLDTVKKRMQAQVLQNTLIGSISVPKYTSISNCFITTLKNEGVKGLYKGIIPTTLKSVVATAVTFVAYDTAKEILRSSREVSTK